MNERHAHVSRQSTRVNNRKVSSSPYNTNAKDPAPKYKTSAVNETAYATANGEPLCTSADHHAALQPLVDYPQKVLRNIAENGVSHREDFGEEEARLSLELEIDESIKSLLRQNSFEKHDRKCNTSNSSSNNKNKSNIENSSNNNNDNLDVTFIQEAASTPVQATVSLGREEVSHLIDMVHAKGTKDVQKETFEYLSTDCASDDVTEGIVPPNCQQVYTTPQQTFNQIRSKLPCLTHSRTQVEDFDKAGTPCLCQHCGMVGVLVESQKRPAIPHMPNPKVTPMSPTQQQQQQQQHPNSSRLRRVIDLRAKSKSETNLILLKELTTKIASLEERLSQHEEKTVKKDYFKFVIHKLLTQYSNKINELRTAAYYTNKNNTNMATQYSRKLVSNHAERSTHVRAERDHNRCFPVKVPTTPRDPTKSSTEDLSSERYHKRSHKARAPKQHAANLSATRCNVHSLLVSTDSLTHPQDDLCTTIDENMSAHAIKNLCNAVYSKYYSSRQTVAQERDRIVPEKLLQQQTAAAGPASKPLLSTVPTVAGRVQSAKNRWHSPPPPPQPPPPQQQSSQPSAAQSGKRMNVSYISSALDTWHDESEQEFVAAKNTPERAQKHAPQRQVPEKRNNSAHVPNTDAKIKPKHSIEEKMQYLKYLAKRKNVNEAELWSNILNQARKHIRSSDDTVSIQLPALMHGPEMSELELTLEKLQEIVRGARNERTPPRRGPHSPQQARDEHAVRE